MSSGSLVFTNIPVPASDPGQVRRLNQSVVDPPGMYRFDIGAIYQYSIPIQISSPLVFPDTLLPTLAAVRAEIAEVRSALTRQQSLLEQILTELNGGVEEIEVQEVDDSEAKRRILELFTDSSGSLFYDDIAERLRLPLRQTVEICNQLELEGLIAEPATKQ